MVFDGFNMLCEFCTLGCVRSECWLVEVGLESSANNLCLSLCNCSEHCMYVCVCVYVSVELLYLHTEDKLVHKTQYTANKQKSVSPPPQRHSTATTHHNVTAYLSPPISPHFWPRGEKSEENRQKDKQRLRSIFIGSFRSQQPGWTSIVCTRRHSG